MAEKVKITRNNLKQMINEAIKGLINQNIVNEDISDFTIETNPKKEQIAYFIKRNYKVKGKIDIDGNIVNIEGNIKAKKNFDSLTDGTFKFGKITGYFSCQDTSIIDLKGAPEIVGNGFYLNGCSDLKSLMGAPKKVGGDFSCNNLWELESLEGCPRIINGDFNCSGCSKLSSLKGGPEIVKGNFDISNCTGIKNLNGAPKQVGAIYCEEQNFSSDYGDSHFEKFSKRYILSKIKVNPNNIHNEFDSDKYSKPISSLGYY